MLSNLRFRALDISLIEKHTFINEKKKNYSKKLNLAKKKYKPNKSCEPGDLNIYVYIYYIYLTELSYFTRL